MPPRRTVVAEDIRYLPMRLSHDYITKKSWLQRQVFKRPFDFAQAICCDVAVTGRALQLIVPEQNLTHANVFVLFQ